MTINSSVTVDDSAWVNLQTSIGVGAGVPLVVQTTSNRFNQVIFVSSETEPVSEEGGFITNEPYEAISCEPDATEFTWVRSVEGEQVLRVQT